MLLKMWNNRSTYSLLMGTQDGPAPLEDSLVASYKLSILLAWVSVSVLVAQSCPTCCNRMDCSLPGSSVHGILQARILEWVAIPFFRRSSWPRDWIQVFCIPGRFFTIWATREAQLLPYNQANELKTTFKTCT